jgi:fatty-acyl-CoA synthase
MRGLMMDYQLTLPTILRRAEQFYGQNQIVSCLPDKSIHRYTYRDMALRAKKLAVALKRLGIHKGDRVAIWCPPPRPDGHHIHLIQSFAIWQTARINFIDP